MLGLVAPLALLAVTAMPPLRLKPEYIPAYNCARTFHIAPGADGDGSEAHPWPSVQAANDSGALTAGDCVVLADGDYPITAPVSLTHGGNRNDATGYVVYRAEHRHGAHLVARADSYQIINLNAAYLILDGLDIDGNHATAGGEGVATSGSAAHHHLVVENCHVHDMGGGGIQLNDAEYFWIVGNETDHNATTNHWQESGISTYQAQAAAPFSPTPADALPWHIVIAGNVSHDNFETYVCATPGCHTDGNGIIIDKTLNVDRKDGVPYEGGVLVAGNVIYGNGGGGIQVYLSEHVTVANNTADNNRLDTQNSGTWRGELSNMDSNNTQWVNNIAYAVPGAGILANNAPVLVAVTNPVRKSDRVVFDSNLIYGAKAQYLAQDMPKPRHMITADPQFADVVAGDFTPRINSPALGKAVVLPFLDSAANIGAW